MVATFGTVLKAWIKTQRNAAHIFTIKASLRNCRISVEKISFQPLGYEQM